MTINEKIRKAFYSPSASQFEYLNDHSFGFYSASIHPWNGYKNKDLNRYSNPINVLYKKGKINYFDDLPKGCYVYYIHNVAPLFGQITTLVTAHKIYYGNSYLGNAVGTVISPMPLVSDHGYVCIMNESDFKIDELLGVSINEAFEAVSKSINWDIANKEFCIKSHLGSMDNKSEINVSGPFDEFIAFESESYTDAKLIKDLFKRGSIMCTGKDLHFVWVDENGICFDANGCIREHDPLFVPVFNTRFSEKYTISDREYDYIIHKDIIAGSWPNA